MTTIKSRDFTLESGFSLLRKTREDEAARGWTCISMELGFSWAFIYRKYC